MLGKQSSKIFIWLQFAGCACLYIALHGDFSLSIWGSLLAIPATLFITALNLISINKVKRPLKTMKPLELGAIACYLVSLYFPLTAYGAVYALHSLISENQYITTSASARTYSSGRGICAKEISLLYSDTQKKQAYCVSSETYKEYVSSRGPFAYHTRLPISAEIKDSFFGRSLVSMKFLTKPPQGE